MTRLLRVLFVEDSEEDTRLIVRELQRIGYEVEYARVETAETMQSELTQKTWDLILSDYRMPRFTVARALEVLQASGLDLPFIIVSGKVGEEEAVSALQAGANDFVLKGHFARLGPAIERGLREAESRRVRKRVEAAYTLSQIHFHSLIEHAPDAIVVVHENGNIMIVNSQAERIFGYDRTELLGKPLEILLPKRFHEKHPLHRSAYFAQPIAQPMGTGLELFGLRRDGNEFPIEISLSPLPTDEGLQAIASIRDITERRRAEEILQEQKRLLSEAQRIGRLGSWSYDLAADTIQFSDEMYRLFDVSPQDFQHDKAGFLSLVYAADRPLMTKWLDDILLRGQVREVEFLTLSKRGEQRYLYCRGAVEFDEAGKPLRFTGTAQDVTERKLSEVQSRQQVARLTALRTIDQAITSSFDLRVTLDVLLAQLISQLYVSAAAIFILDPDELSLSYAAGKGFRTGEVVSTSMRTAASPAVRQRRSVFIENLKLKSDDLRLTSLAAGEGFVSYVGVPLIAKGKVKGVLEVFHRAPLPLSEEWIDFLHTLAGQAAIAIENATLFDSLERSHRELMQAYDATIEGWSRALDLRDRETEGHTQRVTEMTLVLARKFGFVEQQLEYIRWGALLHDIGKMGVPDHILLKAGPLTVEEWASMRTHPQYAYDLLRPISFLVPALPIPYCHHEHWDGTGYPRGLQGTAIPLQARLFAVVDVWDALRSDRPYRQAWQVEKALDYIKSLSGKYFEPQVVDAFLETL